MLHFLWKLIFLKEVIFLGLLFSFLEYYFPLVKSPIKRKERFQDLVWLYFNEHITPHIFKYIKTFLNFSLLIFFFKNKLKK